MRKTERKRNKGNDMNTQLFKGYGLLGMAGFCLLIGSAASADPVGKIEICHKPGERAQRILVINPGSVADHESHGDYVVEPEVCDGLDSDCEKPPVADNDTCDDGIACTVDTCAGMPGCFSVPEDGLCDDGNVNTTDSCDAADPSADLDGCVFTQIAVCGNGVKEAAEQCDDGNNINNDGCDTSCQVTVACPCIDFWRDGNAIGVDFPDDVAIPLVDGGGDCTTNQSWFYESEAGSDLSIHAQRNSATQFECVVFRYTQSNSTIITVPDTGPLTEACVLYVEEDAVPGTNICTDP